MWQSFPPDVHLWPQVTWLLPLVVKDHVAHALLSLQDLLCQDVVFILDGVHVEGKVVFQLDYCKVTGL